MIKRHIFLCLSSIFFFPRQTEQLLFAIFADSFLKPFCIFLFVQNQDGSCLIIITIKLNAEIENQEKNLCVLLECVFKLCFTYFTFRIHKDLNIISYQHVSKVDYKDFIYQRKA